MGIGVLGVTVTGLTTVATGAYFGDTQKAGAFAFTTGTVKLGVAPATAALNLDDVAPGSTVTGPVTVSNDGTLQERYAAVSRTTEDFLAGKLVLTVKNGVSSCTNAGFAQGGETIYSGPLGSVAGTAIVGDPAQGAQVGDRVLPAKASEVLCAQVSFPQGGTAEADKPYQGLSTSATLTFYSEQTANN